MKYIFIICLCLVACDNKSKGFERQEQQKPEKVVRVEKDLAADTAVMRVSREVLTALKNKAFIKLSGFFHPQFGVRFSPYGYVDTASDQVLHADEFIQAVASGDKLYWGSYDGSGDSILLTVAGYYNKFLYNADFVSAEKITLNRRLGTGNTQNNINIVYKGCNYTESFFPGFDKKYGGMDWTALCLVFKSYRGEIYLVAFIHNQWTT